MHEPQPSLIARDETLLGVCAGLGEDFGFNPVWLRIVLAVGLLWNPTAIVATYFGLGVVVLFSRLLVPNRRTAAAAPAAAAAAGPALSVDEEREPLPIAA
jgi:phage shock protein PspC (stress-responsive transcriptional regulator)